MAKYKLLTQEGYATFNFKVGETYDDTAESTTGATVKNMVDTYPDDWQLVEEKQEKRPIMNYVILSAMMLAVSLRRISRDKLAAIPATILGFIY